MKACPHCAGTGRIDDDAAADALVDAMLADAKALCISIYRGQLVSVADAARLTGLSEKRLRNLQYDQALTAHRLSGGRVCFSIRELAKLGRR